MDDRLVNVSLFHWDGEGPYYRSEAGKAFKMLASIEGLNQEQIEALVADLHPGGTYLGYFSKMPEKTDTMRVFDWTPL